MPSTWRSNDHGVRLDLHLHLDRLDQSGPPSTSATFVIEDQVAMILRRAIEVARVIVYRSHEHLAVEDLAAVAGDVGVSRLAVVTAAAEARRAWSIGRACSIGWSGPSGWAISQPSADETTRRDATGGLGDGDCLRTHRTGDGVIVACSPGSGLAAAVGRGVRSVGGTGGLDRVVVRGPRPRRSNMIDRTAWWPTSPTNEPKPSPWYRRRRQHGSGRWVDGLLVSLIALAADRSAPWSAWRLPGSCTATTSNRSLGLDRDERRAVGAASHPEHLVERLAGTWFIRVPVADLGGGRPDRVWRLK